MRLGRAAGLVTCAVGLAVVLLMGPLSRAGDPGRSAVEHPATREVLAMTDAGVGTDVILARIERLESLPELTGEDLAALKKRGVADAVLLQLVRRGSGVHPTADGPKARIRVVSQPDFPLSYLEVRIDGNRVADLGQILVGESEPGQILRPPPRVTFKEPRVLYDDVVDPGKHEVRVGYVVTGIEADPNDEWSEYSRQRYRSSGVRTEGFEEDGSWTTAPVARCRMKAGQTCVVTALPGKRAPTRLGGLPVYSLRYRVDVR